MSSMRLSILLPVRDETLNLKVMLRILQAMLTPEEAEVVVIFDRADDLGIPVVESFAAAGEGRVRGVLNTLGPGVANALRAGVAAARGERILVFAADEVGPVVAIEVMMALMDEGCRFVSCTRYAHGGRRLGGSWIGHFLSAMANRLLRGVSSIALTDATTGIKMFLREDFPRLTHDAQSVGWAVAFEMSIAAHLQGFPLGEVPIISIDRLFGGRSTFRLVPWVIGYLRYFWLAMRRLPPGRRPPVRVRIPEGYGG
ncbi:MAG: glycosyltransferase [Magnetococcales bacterium]|nr:glycosyltransferase [Magnetococcales bacterium]